MGSKRHLSPKEILGDRRRERHLTAAEILGDDAGDEEISIPEPDEKRVSDEKTRRAAEKARRAADPVTVEDGFEWVDEEDVEPRGE